MMLKRKRSFNDDMRSATVNQNTCPPFAKPNMSRSTASESMVSDAPFSRTMKRVRDLRPSEEKVHQHTLDLLFKGQREHTAQQKQQTLLEKPGLNGSTAYVTPSPSPAPEASRLQPQNPQADHAPQNQTAAMISQQQSLHNFWKLPPTVAVASGVASSRPIANITTEATACDDCGLAIGKTTSWLYSMIAVVSGMKHATLKVVFGNLGSLS
ncbi:hypothetical protein BROUX41_000419 [Berkeleyomyces rouxiae]